MPETVLVPMRDGIRLATDVYLPAEGSAFPVVLERTPYGRHLTSRSEITAADRDRSAEPHLPRISPRMATPSCSRTRGGATARKAGS